MITQLPPIPRLRRAKLWLGVVSTSQTEVFFEARTRFQRCWLLYWLISCSITGHIFHRERKRVDWGDKKTKMNKYSSRCTRRRRWDKNISKKMRTALRRNSYLYKILSRRRHLFSQRLRRRSSFDCTCARVCFSMTFNFDYEFRSLEEDFLHCRF